MSENTPCPAKDARKPEPPCDDSSSALSGALYALAKALEAQTFHLAQLTERLAELTENLVELIDQVDSPSEDESYKTLS